MQQVIDTEECLVTMATSSHMVRSQKLLCDPGYDAKFNVLATMMFTAELVYS